MEVKNKWVSLLKQSGETAAARVGHKAGRSLHITGASCIGNTAVGLGKLLMGIVSMSFFTCASAFYTFGMVTAKCVALAGILKEENSDAQYRYYKTSGLILIASSLLYIIYSARLFIRPAAVSYSKYTAIAIAAVTFTELSLNIRGVILERKNHTPLIHAIKMINLASSLICLVLTQTAILSFTSEETEIHPQANGFFGVLMGCAAAILGLAMIIRITRFQKTESHVRETGTVLTGAGKAADGSKYD